MIISGALGNLMDRIRYGAVVDFLDFHVMEYHYPSFNIADSVIVLGSLMILYYDLRGNKSNAS
jgi:signal peptidase II